MTMTDVTAAVPQLVLIAAVARHGIIGGNNQLLWHLPEDLKHFKHLTQGHPVIMGRKTWDSLPPKFRPLPGRHNIVITHDATLDAPGASLVTSLAAAIAAAGAATAFVIGGAQIYALAMPLATRLELTEIDAEFAGDAHFPPVSPDEWQETARDHRASGADFSYDFVTYTRK